MNKEDIINLLEIKFHKLLEIMAGNVPLNIRRGI